MLIIMPKFHLFQWLPPWIYWEISFLVSLRSYSHIIFCYTNSVNVHLLIITLLGTGSSRQFVGFNTEINEHIINQIWERAKEFFPSLREFSLKDLEKSREVRVGLRPFSKYALWLDLYRCTITVKMSLNWFYNLIYILHVSVPGGKPMIGRVPGLSNVFLAAGHEGEGLTLVYFQYS